MQFLFQYAALTYESTEDTSTGFNRHDTAQCKSYRLWMTDLVFKFEELTANLFVNKYPHTK